MSHNGRAKLVGSTIAVGVMCVFAGHGGEDWALGRAPPRVQSAEGEQWDARIDTVSLLTIGNEEINPLHRVSGGVLLGDTLVIAESTSLQFHDRQSGELLKLVGRRGDGPGEYTRIASMQRVGDWLYTYDDISRRVSVHDRSGAFVRTINISYWPPYQTPELVGVFASGSFLIAAEFRDYANPARSPTLRRRAVVLGRYDPDGVLMDSLGYYLGPEFYVAPFGNGGQTFKGGPPFGRRAAAGVLNDEYYIIDNKAPMIQVFDTAGDLQREIGPDQVPEPVRISRADRDWFSGYDDIDNDELPKFYPYYSGGAVVVGNALWVLSYVDPARDPEMEWTVYSHEEGVRVGRVTAKERIKLLAVDGDVAVVVHYGGWDVETVQLRRIVQ